MQTGGNIKATLRHQGGPAPAFYTYIISPKNYYCDNRIIIYEIITFAVK